MFLNSRIVSPTIAFHVDSTTQGCLFSFMTQSERNRINNPVPGLMVYNSSAQTYQSWDGLQWQNMQQQDPNVCNLQGCTTDDLKEGVFNLYFTDTRTNDVIDTRSGAANGICPLDASSIIPDIYLPDLSITNVYVVKHYCRKRHDCSAGRRRVRRH